MSDSVPGPVRAPLAMPGRTQTSPRTVKYPMAFTISEFALGVLIAWGSFQFLGPLAYGALAEIQSPGSGLLTGLWVEFFVLFWTSLAATLLLGAPSAWILGISLRRVRRQWIHIVCFAFLGAVITTATVLLIFWGPAWLTDGHVNDVSPAAWFAEFFAGPCAVSTALGWWCTATLALRRDA